MGGEQLKKRTQAFGFSIIKLLNCLPRFGPAQIIGKQLVRCGTSVGANFRAASRARSRSDFLAKLKIVEEECDESIYWLELLLSMQVANPNSIRKLIDEANQILSIIVASIKTVRQNS